MLAGIAFVTAGVLIGYSWWGDRPSGITIVEQQLGQSQAQVRRVEKRVRRLEAKLGMVEDARRLDG
jgi:hypothetical protein